MGLSIYQVVATYYHADRAIQLDDNATHTPDLIEMTETFGMLGEMWRVVKAGDVVYFARVTEGE